MYGRPSTMQKSISIGKDKSVSGEVEFWLYNEAKTTRQLLRLSIILQTRLKHYVFVTAVLETLLLISQVTLRYIRQSESASG